jgi:predicted dehydrogenase
VQVRFHQWPRAWQAGAAWLKRAEQGGFTREVLSHYVYLLHRLLGDVQLRGASVQAAPGGGAETAAAAVLDCGGVPVSMSGSIGGCVPDLVEARFIGAQRELRLVDWYRLVEHGPDAPGGVPVAGLPSEPGVATYQAQLAQLNAMLSGRPHTLPGFDVALSVQRVVESILGGART